MSDKLPEVCAADFSKISVQRLPHQEIESVLITLGGGGVDGMKFKNDILKRAGWKGDRLTSFAKRPEDAAKAFNAVRSALAKTKDPEQLRQMLK